MIMYKLCLSESKEPMSRALTCVTKKRDTLFEGKIDEISSLKIKEKEKKPFLASSLSK